MISDAALAAPADTSRTTGGIGRAVLTALADYLPLLIPALACLALVLVLRLNPQPIYWQVVFRDLRAYWWWPVPFGLAAALVPVTGWLRHRQSGTPTFHGRSALAVTILFAAAFVALITAWAADRSLFWCITLAGICTGAALAIAVGQVCYDDSWRTAHSASVVARVRRALDSGVFRAQIRRRSGYPVAPPRWGSPHCLLIVEANYRERKIQLLRQLIAGRGVTDTIVNACLDAAWATLEYLNLDWPEQAPPAADWNLRRAEIVREMITMWIWAARKAPATIRVDAGLVDRLLGDIEQDLPETAPPYVAFLRAVFHLRGDADEAVIQHVRECYERIGPSVFAIHGQPIRLREIARATWLAMAASTVDDQLALDVWIEMHRRDEQLVPPTVDGRDPDPAAIAANLEYQPLYTRWVDRIPKPWDDALRTRAKIGMPTIALSETNIWGAVEAEASATASWPYWWVWRTAAVQASLIGRTLAVAVPCLVALAAAVPMLHGNRGWNTVDAVDEYNPILDYRTAETRAMAASGRTLALATSAGLAIIDRDSRVISRYRSGISVLDVTSGPALAGRPDVVLLNEDQSITIVDPERRTEKAAWLRAPPQPVWPGVNVPSPDAVLANQLDDTGWLVAIRGRGVARYRFDRHGSELRRLRSWQTSALSSIDLTGAVATDRGVWLRTTNGVHFADRASLASIDERRIERPLDTFDAATDGTWAVGTQAGTALLFSAASNAWTGGYFRRDNTGLTSERDVTVARLTADGAWLGGPLGLFHYDPHTRALSWIDKSDVRALAIAGQDVLAATGEALLRVSGGVAAHFDENATSTVSTSVDGRAAIWQRRGESDNEVRYRLLDSSMPAPLTLFGKGGWKRQTSPPVILGVHPIDAATTLFTTDRGAFFYNFIERIYSDCSKSLFRIAHAGAPAQDQIVDLTQFSNVEPHGARILAIADGNPQTIALGAKQWDSLDPLRQTHPVQLTAAGDRVFGVGARGELHEYAPGRRDYSATVSQAFVDRPSAGNEFVGDVRRAQGDHFNLALLHQGAVVLYDSAKGEIADEKLRFFGDEPAQVRLLSDGVPVYVTRAGLVLDRDHRTLFGSGGLPFAATAVTAIATGRNPGTVLVGGAGGYVGEYDGSNAAWSAVDDRLSASGTVTAIEADASGTLVQMSTGASFFHFATGSWIPLAGYQKVVKREDRLYALDRGALVRLAPTSAVPAEWPRERYSSGAGMQSFVARAIAAWPRTPGAIVVVRTDGHLGEYNVSSDSWREIAVTPFGDVAQTMVVGGRLVVFDRSGHLVQLEPDLKTVPLAVLPAGASIGANATTIRSAYVQNGVLNATMWSNGGQTRIDRVRGSRAPYDLDPSAVVYAEKNGAAVRFVDDRGNVVDYVPASGAWVGVRGAAPGETVLGWQPPEVDQPLTTLVIAQPTGTTALVRIRDGAVTPLAQAPDGFAVPRNGLLLDANQIRLVRAADRTTITFRGRALTAERGGFVEDVFLDAAVDASGRIVALRHGALAAYDVMPEGLVATGDEIAVPSGAESIAAVPASARARFNLRPPAPPDVFASIPFATRQLQFVPSAAGGVDVRWLAAGGEPVWGSCGGFSWQCIRDFAVPGAGDVLLSTEIGLVVRDIGSYRVSAVYSQLAQATFAGVGQPRRLYISSGNGQFEWTNRRPVPHATAADDFTTTIAASGATWTYRPSDGLTVTARAGAPREMVLTAAREWRFRDDVVRWIYRDGATYCVATAAGTFAATELLHRGDGRCSPDETDRVQLDHPALRVTAQHGRVTLVPFDGATRPAIARGRLFFDNSSQIAGVNDRLLTLVAGRGLFERDRQNAAAIVRAWRLPTVPGDVVLEAAGASARLVDVGARGARIGAQDLDMTRGTWTRQSIARDVRRTAGLVEWQAATERHASFTPYALVGGRRALPAWWSVDRFAWDAVTGAALLSANTVVAATAAGPLVARIGAGQLEWIAWRPDRPAIRASTARENGRAIGVVVAGGDGLEALVTEHDRQVIFSERGAARTLAERPTVTIQWAERSPRERELDLVETWDVANGPALRHGLTELTGRLFREGQLAFDGLAAGAAAGATWWVAPPCTAGGCILTQNEVREGRLILRDLVPAPCAFVALRTAADGSPLGLCAGGERTVMQLTQGRWSAVSGETVRARFRYGDRVSFAVRRLDWTIDGAADPWSPAAFRTDVADYPLFAASHGGISLSFDMLTSIAFHAPSRHLAIGSRGGLWWLPVDDGGEAAVGRRGALALSLLPRIESPRDWAVSRIYAEESGALWARLESGSVVNAGGNGAFGSTRMKTWPDAVVTRGGVRVQLGEDGVHVSGPAWIYETNDAWRIGRQPIAGIVGFYCEPGAAWVASGRHGVIKVVRPAAN